MLEWIDRSILDINSTMAVHFVIADGIVAMEGNGPLHGTARDLGRVVMSDDPVAADFTCARLMGFDPYRISHLAQAAEFLGNGDLQRIDQLGEKLPRTVRPFSVLPEFAHLIGGDSPPFVKRFFASRNSTTRQARPSPLRHPSAWGICALARWFMQPSFWSHRGRCDAASR